MPRRPFAALPLLFFCFASRAQAAPPPPTGAHPRIWLTPATVTAMKAKMGDASSAAAAVIAHCKDVQTRPTKYRDGIYRGYGWAYAAASCGVAYQLTQDPGHAQAGVRMMKCLLNDRDTEGDGAGGDNVIDQDTGYAVRYHPPFVAIAYDMLKGSAALDGATESLAVARMKTWIDSYTSKGYLNHQYGSNYHAGYVIAKTMVAIALSGDDPKGATYWNDVVDDVFAVDIVDKGLKQHKDDLGGLAGGDWPEGWDYGNQSVEFYAAATRALADLNVHFPELEQYYGDLVLHHHYALMPDRKGYWTAGDNGGQNALYPAPSVRPFLAMMFAPSGDKQAAWAASLHKQLFNGERDEAPVFDALAEARGLTPKDFVAENPPMFYVTRGTRTLFARSSWDDQGYWAAFQSSPHLVPDHQHIDATNFGFARGHDQLIIDPSPYASLSSLTSNALTVDSQSVQDNYRPSQSPYGFSELVWARGFQSHTAAARGDFAAAFRWDDKPSDVPFARRDFVFFPEGEVMVLDRVRTDSPSRNMYLRFRTPVQLSYSDPVAKGIRGGSQVAIHKVLLSGGTPSTRTVSVDQNCSGNNFGTCNVARVACDEYSVKVPGPNAVAFHVIDGLPSTDLVPAVDAIPDRGITGASVQRGNVRLVMAASSATDGAPPQQMKYGVAGDVASRHVVFDAPEAADGHSNVTAAAENGKCVVTITAGAGFEGRPLAFMISPASDGCKVTEDRGVTPLADPGKPAQPSDGDAGPGSGGGGNGDSGCGCSTPGVSAGSLAWLAGLVLAAAALGRRRQG
jgi:MYXO-CTERM domain-containing protein